MKRAANIFPSPLGTAEACGGQVCPVLRRRRALVCEARRAKKAPPSTWILPSTVLIGAALLLTPGGAAVGGEPRFHSSEGWDGSGLAGHAPGKESFWTTKTGAWAEWVPAFSGPVTATVWMYKIVHSVANDTNVAVRISHAGQVEDIVMNWDEGETGWVDLGTHEFSGGEGEHVRLMRVSTEGSTTRFSAVQFNVLGPNGAVLHSLLMDEVTHGPLVEENTWTPTVVTFEDIQGHADRRTVGRLATRGIVAGLTTDRFEPDESVTLGSFCLWLVRALDQIDPQSAWSECRPETTAERGAALRDARQRGYLEPPGRADDPVDGKEAAAILSRAAARSGRFAAWGNGVFSCADADRSLTRSQAAGALWRLVETVVEAGPPPSASWRLTFQEEFEGDALDLHVWQVESGSPGHILSSRWPENVEVRDGTLSLHTRKEERGGKPWTTGNIWTRHFRQQYGYFEARMRVGGATGLNNAFWVMTSGKPTDPVHFEIDFTEAHFPNRSHMTVHNWSGKHTASGTSHYAAENLHEDFHVYGAEWTADEVVWYLDGKEVRRVRQGYCGKPAPVRLSSAVIRFAGRITDALDGTAQVVDWVRVYERADHTAPPEPAASP